MNKYLIPGAIVIAGILIAGAFIFVNYFSNGTLSSQEAADKTLAFVNKNIETGAVAVLVAVTEKDMVYQISLTINGTQYESYITKDGKFLFPSGISLEEPVLQESTQTGDTTNTTQTSVASETFAKCLTEKGAKFYGAWWCSHCQNQKKTFGDAFQYVNYIECEQNPGTSQGNMTDTCKEAKIASFPTWDFADGTRKTGEVTLESLSEITGCKI